MCRGGELSCTGEDPMHCGRVYGDSTQVLDRACGGVGAFDGFGECGNAVDVGNDASSIPWQCRDWIG